MGRPLPSKILPSISLDTGSLTVSPVNLTRVFPTSRPVVPSKTCTTATPPPISRTWPLLSSPLGVLIRASSPYPTPRTDSTKSSGPEISLIVVYSRPASATDYFPPIALNICVQRIAGQPVDSWKVASRCQVCIERPEDLCNSQRILSDRFGEIPAGR